MVLEVWPIKPEKLSLIFSKVRKVKSSTLRKHSVGKSFWHGNKKKFVACIEHIHI